MKKTLLSVAIALTSLSFSAQTTITSHFAWALTDPANPQVAVWSWGTGGVDGYVCGNNTYGDIGTAQLFDTQIGVASAGTVSSIKAYIPNKVDAGGSIEFRIYANNAGALGAMLGSTTVTIASIDTNQSALQVIPAGAGIGGVYNIEATFSSPIAFTANGFFAVYTAGSGANVIGGASTSDNIAAYPLALTHTGAISSGNAFDNFGQYDLNIALAVFPTVTFSAPTSIEEMVLEATVYENNNKLYVSTADNNVTISLVNMMGQTVETFSHNSSSDVYDLNNMPAGIYLVNLANAEGKSTIQKITVK